MNNKTHYTYTILRYVHDVATGEFLNVGVALHAPERRFINVQCRTTFARLKSTFPNLDGDAYRAIMRHVLARFEGLAEQLRDQLDLVPSGANALTFAESVLARDDSSLQWSPVGAGLTRDPEVTLEQLFERMVMRNDKETAAIRKQDEDVWRPLSAALQQRQLLKYFQEKTIAVQDDEVQFRHAWKNGVWHCLEPLSFDLASADSIKNKAHRWLGQLASVQGSSEPFQMYFVVAEPSESDLIGAFQSALSILRKAPQPPFIFRESEVTKLAEKIEAEVQTHFAG